MTDIFKHKFGGWCEADAWRWKNPDGSEGGIVATSARVHDGVSLPASVEVWPNAKISDRVSIGSRASIGDGVLIGEGASIEADDWFFVAGPQSSRAAWATAVFSKKSGLLWGVGCQHGITTETLNERIERYHGASEMGDDYRHLVQTVLSHPGLARAKSNEGIE